MISQFDFKIAFIIGLVNWFYLPSISIAQQDKSVVNKEVIAAGDLYSLSKESASTYKE